MRNLSKSKLVAYRQCPKRLWLEVHRPELREDSFATQASFQVGYQVGDVARRIYDPAGNGALIDIETEGFEGAFARTAQLLATSQAPVFEAGLRMEGALAFADVLLPEPGIGKQAWKMIEVKSAASLKEYYHDDIAIQAFVARSSGVNLKSVALAHIDSSWVYPGDEDYRGLLKENDLTEEVFARTKEVKGWLAEAQAIVALPAEPEKEVGPHCSYPFECGFCNYCYKDIEQPEFPLDLLPNLSSRKREHLAELGVTDLRGVPDDLLSERQFLVKEHTLNNTVFFDAEGAAADLAPHGYPAYFLDFESIQFAVPIWKGTRPYQKIVFQFSLHIVSESGHLEHISFLDLSGKNPTEALANSLVSACGQSGPVYVYFQGFEKGRIRELAEQYPDLASSLHAINARVVDLLPVARDHYYHPSMGRSWSIKGVLPAAIPELSYGDLDGVQDGGTAMEVFLEALHPETSKGRKTEIEQQLLAYCRLDTYAMVRLWELFSGQNKP